MEYQDARRLEEQDWRDGDGEAMRLDETRRQEQASMLEKIRQQEEVRRLAEARRLEEDKARKTEAEEKDLKEHVKRQVSPGALRNIHQHGKTYTKSTVVQILRKTIVEGKLLSLTCEIVSENVFPVDEESAKIFMEIPQYDLLQIDAASVKGDKLFLNDVVHLEITNKKGLTVNLKEAIQVNKLRKLTNESMKLFAVQFPNFTRVEFDCNTKNANATICEDDSALEEVGKKAVVSHIESQSQPAPASAVRSKRKLVSCPWCVRTFTDADRYKKHIKDDH